MELNINNYILKVQLAKGRLIRFLPTTSTLRRHLRHDADVLAGSRRQRHHSPTMHVDNGERAGSAILTFVFFSLVMCCIYDGFLTELFSTLLFTKTLTCSYPYIIFKLHLNYNIH